MCARYSLTQEGITILIGEIEVIINLGARYNLAPPKSFRPSGDPFNGSASSAAGSCRLGASRTGKRKPTHLSRRLRGSRFRIRVSCV